MKTPEKKAKELVEQFHGVNKDGIYNMTAFQAKQCALIAVNEIIKELQTYSDLKSVIVIDDIERTVISRIIYWNKVKREINRL